MSEPLIVRADARCLPLPDSSVDLIVTSPPYFALRSYTDGGRHYDGQLGSEETFTEFLDALIDATREMVRVLKPTGSIFVNLGDKYCAPGGHTDRGASSRLQGRRAQRNQGRPDRTTTSQGVPAKSLFGIPWRYAIRCIDELGLILRSEIVWSKPNGLPESVTDRVRRSHEQLFHFTVRPRYFASVDDVREPHQMRPQRRPNGRPEDLTPRQGQPKQTWSTAARTEPGVDGHPLGRLPGSVWEIPTQPLDAPAELGVDHYAAFPMEIPRRVIRGWCPPDGLVLDPFGGTGTTALVAKALGRPSVSVDLSGDYCRLAGWRTTDPGELARALQVPRPQPTVPEQVDLLSALEDAS